MSIIFHAIQFLFNQQWKEKQTFSPTLTWLVPRGGNASFLPRGGGDQNFRAVGRDRYAHNFGWKIFFAKNGQKSRFFVPNSSFWTFKKAEMLKFRAQRENFQSFGEKMVNFVATRGKFSCHGEGSIRSALSDHFFPPPPPFFGSATGGGGEEKMAYPPPPVKRSEEKVS